MSTTNDRKAAAILNAKADQVALQLRQALKHLHVAAQDYAEGSPEWRAIDNAIAYVETAAEIVTGKRPG